LIEHDLPHPTWRSQLADPCETIGPTRPELSILIPVYNERTTVLRVIEKVRAVPFPDAFELVLVDDGSTDGSRELLRGLPASRDMQVHFHDANSGKGAAIRTALGHARGRIVVIQDADEELDPRDLLPMYEIVSSRRASVCYGSRFLGKANGFPLRPIYLANRFLNGISNLLNGLRLTDMNTCYKMMRVELARRLDIQSRGFSMEPEITTKLARMNVEIVECPVTYRPRARAEGKKIRAVDFVRYLAAMLRFRFSGKALESHILSVSTAQPE
jgi:glycosyltransferase involved in cell wall biosynthesis